VLWLAGGVNTKEPQALGFLPLRAVLPEAFSTSPVFRQVLIVALVGDSKTRPDHQGAFEGAARAISLDLMAQDFPRLLTQMRSLGDAFKTGTLRLLAPGALQGVASLDDIGTWDRVVDAIRELMDCDACQLYLIPQYAPQDIQGADAQCIWLVAESVKDRTGMKYYRKEDSLTSYLWRSSRSEAYQCWG